MRKLWPVRGTSTVLLLIMAVALLLMGLGCSKTTQPAAKPVNPVGGKTVEIVVPFAPGGSFDAICRLTAPYFEKALEEITGADQTVIVVNKPGAAGKLSYNYIYTKGPDDPSFVLMSVSAIPQQVGMKTDYDVTKFTYLGRAGTQYQGIYVHKNSLINSFDQLVSRSQTKPILLGTSGFGASEHQAALFLSNVLKTDMNKDLKFEFVHYKGVGEILAGLKRGEIEAGIDPLVDVVKAIRTADAKGLAQIAPQRTDILPDVPTLVESGIPENVSTKLQNLTLFKYSFVGSPKMNGNLADVFRKALRKALQDPELLAKAKQAELPIQYTDFERDLQHSKEALAAMSEFKDLLKELFK